MKLKIYLGPSIFTSYFENFKSRAIEVLFSEIEKGNFFGFYSLLTIDELSFLPSPLKENTLNLIKKSKLYLCEFEPEDIVHLVQNYLEEKILVPEMEFAACHFAIATINEMDIFASVDTTYSANEFLYRRFKKVNQKFGYAKTPEIRMPEEITGVPGPYENLKLIHQIRKQKYEERKEKNISLLDYLISLQKKEF
ncbi:MAG: hypothetical protein N2323_04525 [candidate division WOR-3 bacterium]|nr:hypothetical protein [candidate division WOR-3 bacterium]MCX7837207.1 hypothetical protein [candidate division WOR-3 bacterium]MDW8114599.1 hypothetical protein [candidate division WOR-3 bacterium]